MWAAPMSLLAGVPVAILNWRLLPGVFALIWAFSLALFACYGPIMRRVPGPVGLVKVLWLGLAGIVGVVIWGLAIGGWDAGAIVGWSLGILAVALLLGFDLDGSGPLHAGSTSAYWAGKWPGILDVWARFGYHVEPCFELAVDAERCRGCARCVSVCPKGVFELYRLDGGQASRVARPEACVLCTACVKQCPEGAILADPPVARFTTTPAGG